jgi:hypothetical protein
VRLGFVPLAAGDAQGRWMTYLPVNLTFASGARGKQPTSPSNRTYNWPFFAGIQARLGIAC